VSAKHQIGTSCICGQIAAAASLLLLGKLDKSAVDMVAELLLAQTTLPSSCACSQLWLRLGATAAGVASGSSSPGSNLC
jgi:hypothetical protein